MDMQITQTTEQPKNKKWTGHVRDFFGKHGVLFCAPIIILCMYTVALFAYNVWPFSHEFTSASYDLSAQIVPYIEHLFDVFDGKSTLTYSYAIMGGTDVTGTFLYFFVSPFSFLFLIFGDGMVAHASSVVMGLKVAAIAFAGSWFAKKQFDNIPDFWCVAVGVLYGYCGYAFVSCTYINWMDFLIYMPFCITAFSHMSRTGKYLPFSLLIACQIYTCFSIACFSMFTVFPVLVAYALICKGKGERLPFVAKICLAFVVAILFALPLLVPAFMSYLRSSRNSEGLFHTFWFGFSKDAMGNLAEFSSEDFLKRWSEALFFKWSYILSDTLFVILTIVWFMRIGLKKPFAKFMLVAGVLTMLPTLVDEAMLLMNMGSYYSYALRFGFLNAAYYLGGACLCLQDIYAEKQAKQAPLKTLWHVQQEEPIVSGAASDEQTDNIANDGGMYATNTCTPKVVYKEKLSVWAIIFTVIGVLTAAFFAWYITAGNFQEMWITESMDDEIKSGLRDFASRYAHSYGGLEVIGVWFTLLAVLFTVGYILYARNKLGVRLLSGIILISVGIQAIFYNNQLVIGNRSTQHTGLEQFTAISQVLNEKEDGYFRIKDYNDEFTAPAPFVAECNSFSTFSSVTDKDNFEIMNLFGYAGGSNILKSAHDFSKGNRSDEFGDSFLGYKYFVVKESYKDYLITDHVKRAYVSPVYVEDENGEMVHLQEGNFYVFKNEIVFPSAYRVSSGNFRFVSPNVDNDVNRKYNQQALYKYLRGKTLGEMQKVTGSNSSEFVTPKTARELSEYLWGKSADIQVGAGKITAKTTASSGEYLFLNFVASKGYQVTVNGKKAQPEDNDLHFLCVALEEGENTVVFTYKSPYTTYALLGTLGALFGLLAVLVVTQKTQFFQKSERVIAWAGVALAAGLLAFYFVFPTAVWVFKLFKLFI